MRRALPILAALLLSLWLLDLPAGSEPGADASADGSGYAPEASLLGRAVVHRPQPAPKPGAANATPTPHVANPTPRQETERVTVRVVRGTPEGPPVEGVPIHRGETVGPLREPDIDTPLGYTDFEGKVVVDVPKGLELVHARAGKDYVDWAVGWVRRDPKGPTIVIRPARVLTGRVLGVPAEHMASLYIQSRWKNPDGLVRGVDISRGWARADKDGRFEIKVPADAFHVQLFAMPAGAWRPEPHGLTAYAGVFVEKGDDGPFTLDFRGAVTVTGEVVGEDGTPIPHGNVSFDPVDRPPLLGTDALLQNKGSNRFTLAGLAPGRYRVRASAIDSRWASTLPREIVLPLRGPLRIEMPRAHLIRGRVVGLKQPKGVHAEWWRRAGPGKPYVIQARRELSRASTFALTRVADGDTLLRIIRGHTVLADLTHLRVPDDDVVVVIEKKKKR